MINIKYQTDKFNVFNYFKGNLIVILKPQIIELDRRLDFRKGFYLTSNFEQASRWAKLIYNFTSHSGTFRFFTSTVSIMFCIFFFCIKPNV